MDWEVAFRLLLTGFCIVAPTLLYVGLVRALDRLRDDPFVERVLMRMEEDFESETGARRGPLVQLSSFAREATRETADPTSTAASGPACSRCGAPNPSYARFCDVCLSRISD